MSNYLTFLAIVGPTTYKILSSLVTPEKPGDKSYAELVQVLFEPLLPRTLQHCSEVSFLQPKQTPRGDSCSLCGENVLATQHCNFRLNLETMLCNRIVSGINNQYIVMFMFSNEDTELQQFFIAVEHELILETSNLTGAIFLCIAAHNVYNLAYHKKTGDI